MLNDYSMFVIKYPTMFYERERRQNILLKDFHIDVVKHLCYNPFPIVK